MTAAQVGILPPHFWQCSLWEIEAVIANALRAETPASAGVATDDDGVAGLLRQIGGEDG